MVQIFKNNLKDKPVVMALGGSGSDAGMVGSADISVIKMNSISCNV